MAAKADIFESNLNLGLQLAATGQPDAEQFLRAATKLKPPRDQRARARKRAWMALGNVLAASKPEEAAAAFQQAAMLDPKDPEPHLLAASLLEKQHHWLRRRRNISRRWRLIRRRRMRWRR